MKSPEPDVATVIRHYRMRMGRRSGEFIDPKGGAHNDICDAGIHFAAVDAPHISAEECQAREVDAAGRRGHDVGADLSDFDDHPSSGSAE